MLSGLVPRLSDICNPIIALVREFCLHVVWDVTQCGGRLILFCVIRLASIMTLDSMLAECSCKSSGFGLSGLVPRSFEAAYPLNGCPPLLLYNHYDKPIR